MQTRIIGTAVPRKEARDKVTGAARYVDDVAFPGMIHGITVRSPVARGTLLGHTLGPLLGGRVDWSEFTIVTAADIPGLNAIRLLNDDQPCLADGVVNHPEEAILLLAHPDRAMLERARRAVSFRIDPLPAVFTLEQALGEGEEGTGRPVIWGTDNVFKEYVVDKGDVDAVFGPGPRDGVIVVEGEYETGAQEQLYIETNGMIAAYDERDGVTVWGSLQCPYYIQKALMPLFGLPPEKTRVIQLETGGGFGGKEEYPSMIAAHAALLARKAGRPVKMIYDRSEDMAATTKRHPSRTRHRTAVTPDGRLLAMDIDFVVDGGAYSTLSQVVLSRGTIHAAGPYECPSTRIRGRAVATNCPPHGAFRGFGAPQSLFALERQLDRVAAAVGLSPAELRRRNFCRKGTILPTGQAVRDDVDMGALMDKALAAADYHGKRARFQEENRTGPVKRGVGFACFLHGTGFTGSGEKHLASVVGVRATAEGRVEVLSASTEIGQGTSTIFAQVAAEALEIGYDSVDIVQPDTAHVPNSGPTVASRTVTIVGKLVEGAALALRQTLLGSGLLSAPYTPEQFAAACGAYIAEFGSLKATGEYKQPGYVTWDEARFRGDAYGAYSWAVYVATVAVDVTTYEARVEDFVALQEVGKVIHPVLAAGQIEGGVAQGIGWALYENAIFRDGRMQNDRMTDYIMPTSVDLPAIRVLFEESPYEGGPAGAKGIGELPMDGPAPAILNAIQDAVGISVHRIPATPEILFGALLAAGGATHATGPLLASTDVPQESPLG